MIDLYDRAYAALKLLRIPELKMTMHAAIERFEIYPSSKIRHFEALRRKTGIECSDMIFFDDEWRNNEVRTLGVHFHHVDSRKGVTMQQFMDALSKYDRDSRYIQTKLDFSKHWSSFNMHIYSFYDSMPIDVYIRWWLYNWKYDLVMKEI